MFGHFMLKLGGKIGPCPFWTYIWEGGGELTDFPPSIHVSTDASIDASTDASTHASTDVGVYAHLLDIFGNFKDFLKNLGPEQVKKVRFLIGIWCIPRFRGNFSPPAAKKVKTKRFYIPSHRSKLKIVAKIRMKFFAIADFSKKSTFLRERVHV